VLKTRNKPHIQRWQYYKKMRKIIIVFLISIFFSCSNNDSEEFVKQEISGIYKIDRFVSSESADLNEDGISNKNFKSELLDYFNEIPLKISELPKHEPFDLLFAIYLPYPNEIVDKPYGHLIYDLYALFKRLKFKNGELNIHENDLNSEDKIIFQRFEIISDSKIEISLIMKLYDFENLKWKNYKCKILYIKTE
jgi:hypothetical protein